MSEQSSKSRERQPTDAQAVADDESPSARRSGASTEDLLRILVNVTARVAFTEERLRAVVLGGSKAPEKWIAAYNLCDGTRGQREIARLTGVDQGALSRAVVRWVDAGVAFKVGPDGKTYGLYPLQLSVAESGAEMSDGVPAARKARRERAVRPNPSSGPPAPASAEQADLLSDPSSASASGA